jgi:multiple sugar transport system permease protein
MCGRGPEVPAARSGKRGIAVTAITAPRWSPVRTQANWLVRLFDWKPFLVFVCMLPAVGLLLTFLTYPLGLGIWLAFTDTTIGRSGQWVGLENFEFLIGDRLFWQAVFYSVFYTSVATVGKFGLGLWLALLLNNRLPFKSILRAIILLPWIVPTVLSAIAFWWIYDPQFSIISYVFVDQLGVRDKYFDFLGSTWPARWSLIVANIWRGIPFVAISLLAGLQTISPSLYEAALLDGSTAWQRFRFITFPLLLPILAIVMTFSIIFTFTDFQLVYAITRGGPVNSTHLMATLAFQRGIPGGMLGEGAAIAVSMIPFLVFATLFSYFALARRKWQQGESND